MNRSGGRVRAPRRASRNGADVIGYSLGESGTPRWLGWSVWNRRWVKVAFVVIVLAVAVPTAYHRFFVEPQNVVSRTTVHVPSAGEFDVLHSEMILVRRGDAVVASSADYVAVSSGSVAAGGERRWVGMATRELPAAYSFLDLQRLRAAFDAPLKTCDVPTTDETSIVDLMLGASVDRVCGEGSGRESDRAVLSRDRTSSLGLDVPDGRATTADSGTDFAEALQALRG